MYATIVTNRYVRIAVMGNIVEHVFPYGQVWTNSRPRHTPRTMRQKSVRQVRMGCSRNA